MRNIKHGNKSIIVKVENPEKKYILISVISSLILTIITGYYAFITQKILQVNDSSLKLLNDSQLQIYVNEEIYPDSTIEIKLYNSGINKIANIQIKTDYLIAYWKEYKIDIPLEMGFVSCYGGEDKILNSLESKSDYTYVYNISNAIKDYIGNNRYLTTPRINVIYLEVSYYRELDGKKYKEIILRELSYNYRKIYDSDLRLRPEGYPINLGDVKKQLGLYE